MSVKLNNLQKWLDYTNEMLPDLYCIIWERFNNNQTLTAAAMAFFLQLERLWTNSNDN